MNDFFKLCFPVDFKRPRENPILFIGPPDCRIDPTTRFYITFATMKDADKFYSSHDGEIFSRTLKTVIISLDMWHKLKWEIVNNLKVSKIEINI